jgi:hypothetical protein
VKLFATNLSTQNTIFVPHGVVRQCPTQLGLIIIRDRCCDFLNIFDEKFSENIGVFCSNYW